MKTLPRHMNEYGEMVVCGHDAQDGETSACGTCATCRTEARSEGRVVASFRDHPRGPPCSGCDGSGTCSDRNMNDPRSREVACTDCDGSGLSCRDCRYSKNGICQSCSVEAVEQLFEGVL